MLVDPSSPRVTVPLPELTGVPKGDKAALRADAVRAVRSVLEANGFTLDSATLVQELGFAADVADLALKAAAGS
jgi:hypothetical protein